MTSKQKRPAAETKRARIKWPFPRTTLEQALEISYTIKEKNGGNPCEPEEIRKAISAGTGGNAYFYLTAASRDYGLTIGTRDADKIALADLGREIVYAPNEDVERRLTWLIVAGMTACWMISVRRVPGWTREGWPSLFKSLYGFVWLDFGLDILLRFLMLSYNAVEWGNGTPRLVAQTTDTVNTTLAYCGLYWLLVSVAYAFMVRRRGAGPLTLAPTFTVDFAYAAAIPIALLASVVFHLTEGQIPIRSSLIST